MIYWMRGFSLFELLAVIFIVTIMLFMIVPGQKNRITAAKTEVDSSQLLRAINLARSESILRDRPVVLCKSSNQISCGGEWRDGYVISVDNKVVFSFRNQNKGEWHLRLFRKDKENLEFLPSGLIEGENGSFWYCESREKKPIWAVVINQSGRARLVAPDLSGKISDDSGVTLTC